MDSSRRGYCAAYSIATLIALLTTCIAPIHALDGEWQDCLDLHNELRAVHSAAPLDWRTELAQPAEDWAKVLADDNCNLRHSSYGENIYAYYGFKADGNGVDATQMWYDEIKQYKFTNTPYSSNSLAATGHFTQVVWRDSSALGCGSASNSAKTCTVVVCQYLMYGNMQGNAPYLENVRPPGGVSESDGQVESQGGEERVSVRKAATAPAKKKTTKSKASPPPKRKASPPPPKAVKRKASPPPPQKKQQNTKSSPPPEQKKKKQESSKASSPQLSGRKLRSPPPYKAVRKACPPPLAVFRKSPSSQKYRRPRAPRPPRRPSAPFPPRPPRPPRAPRAPRKSLRGLMMDGE